MKNSIDINCDMGELFPHQSANVDRLLMPFVSSVSISCGAHSGTINIIGATIINALEYNLRIGAHPSYPDRINSGRVSMKIAADVLKDSIFSQLEWLENLLSIHGGNMKYVKAHGALYNDIAQNAALADTYLDCIMSYNSNLPIMGLAHSALDRLCRKRNIDFIAEAFADRRYNSDLTLCARSVSDALITDAAHLVTHLEHLLNEEVSDIENNIHPLSWDSLCFHSDTSNALELLKSACAFISKKGIDIAADQ